MSTFEIATKTYSGYGITKSALGEILQSFKRPLTIMDSALERPDFLPPAIECPPGEPTYSGLGGLWWRMEEQDTDCIIAFGGGSTMDYAKAIAALYNTPSQPTINFRGFDKIPVPGIPCICIPTTAGTGSEVTPNAVFTDLNEKRKLGINGRHVRAARAILDAQWLETCPKEAATSALLDAFVHAIESYMSPKASPITKALSREAFRLLYRNALENNPEGKQNLLYGAYLAAMALCNTTSGVCGAMSYPLGVHFGIPHGYAGGIFLPDLVAMNENRDYFCDIHPESKLLAWRLSYNLGDLWMRLGVPKTLHKWIKPTDILPMPIVSQEALDRNPVPISLTDVHDIIARHM